MGVSIHYRGSLRSPITMDLIDEKLEYISNELSSSPLSDVAGLSADQIASRIEQLLLGNKGGHAENRCNP